LVGGLTHNIEVVVPRHGKGFALIGRFDNEADSHANNNEPDHKKFPHEERVTVCNGWGKYKMVLKELGNAVKKSVRWVTDIEVGGCYLKLFRKN